MFNLNQIKEIRTKKNLDKNDIQILRELQLCIYNEYADFYMNKATLDIHGDNSLSNLSVKDYLAQKYAEIEQGTSPIKNSEKEFVKNLVDSACVYIAGRKPFLESCVLNGKEFKSDTYADIMEIALVKLATNIPMKRSNYISHKDLSKTDSFRFSEIQSEISNARNIYSFTSRMLDDRFVKMHEQNYANIRETGKTLYSEFTFDLIEYQHYTISQNLAKIVKYENQLENRRFHKMRKPAFMKSNRRLLNEFMQKNSIPEKKEQSEDDEQEK